MKLFLHLFLVIPFIFFSCNNDDNGTMNSEDCQSEFGNSALQVIGEELGPGIKIISTKESEFLTLSGIESIILTKFDSNNSVVWTYNYSDNFRDYTGDIIESVDGGLLITGTRSPREVGANTELLVLKVNSQGIEQWSYTFDSGFDDYGYSLVETELGEIIAVGVSNINDEIFAPSDFLMVKLNSSGEELLVKSEDFSKNDHGRKIIKTEQNEFTVLVTSETENSLDPTEIKILKYDDNLNQLEHYIFQEFGNLQRGFSMVQAGDGGILIIATENTIGSNKPSENFVFKINSIGELMWSSLFGSEKTDIISSLIEVEDMGIVVTGASESCKQKNNLGLYLAKLNSEGDLLWERLYNEEMYEFGGDLLEKENNELIIVGGVSNEPEGVLKELVILETNQEGKIN